MREECIDPGETGRGGAAADQGAGFGASGNGDVARHPGGGEVQSGLRRSKPGAWETSPPGGIGQREDARKQ